MLRFKIYVDI